MIPHLQTAHLDTASTAAQASDAFATAAASSSETVVIGWASTVEEVHEVQRLRYQVFSDELGVNLQGHDGLDEDQFDACAKHLFVRDVKSGQVVGTYRVLPRECTRDIGFYSAQEFDITAFASHQDKVLEVGRACVHKDHRNGGVLMALWKAVLQYTMTHGYEMILGCTSVPIAANAPSIADIEVMLQNSGAMSEEFKVAPRNPFDNNIQPAVDADVRMVLPPLFKGYLRLGAQVCGAPTYDPDFHTADFLTVLKLSHVSPRYAKHFNL